MKIKSFRPYEQLWNTPEIWDLAQTYIHGNDFVEIKVYFNSYVALRKNSYWIARDRFVCKKCSSFEEDGKRLGTKLSFPIFLSILFLRCKIERVFFCNVVLKKKLIKSDRIMNGNIYIFYYSLCFYTIKNKNYNQVSHVSTSDSYQISTSPCNSIDIFFRNELLFCLESRQIIRK